MAKKKLTPAELVAARFGGTRAASRKMRYSSETVVHKWIERGGEIRDIPRVLQTAKELGIKFTAQEAIYGGYV